MLTGRFVIAIGLAVAICSCGRREQVAENSAPEDSSGRRVTESVALVPEDSAEAVWERKLRSAAREFPGKATVAKIAGANSVRVGRGRDSDFVREGAEISEGSSVESGDAVVDLGFSDRGPQVRLERQTKVELARVVREDSGIEIIYFTMIELRMGRVRANLLRSAGSEFLVRTKSNIVMASGQLEISADGGCAVTSGSAEVLVGTNYFEVRAGDFYHP